jgi:ribonucleoside-diphosphate reductase alpha chain
LILFNPEISSGVLVNKDDLKATRYTFTLSNGETVTVAGDEYVEYDGQTHMASNLADAIKNGVYGKM